MKASMSIAGTFKPLLNPSPNLEIHVRQPIPTKLSRIAILSTSEARAVNAKCSSSNTNSSGLGESQRSSLKDVLSGMVDERVEKLLDKEENRVLLDGLQKATQRVEMAKRELAQIQRQEAEAKLMRDYVNQLQSRTSEIAECQKEILEAKAMVEKAERSLSMNLGSFGDRDSVTKTESESVNRNEERLESVKAASISAIAGTLAGLPLSLARVTSNSDLILPLAITFVSCALFGVTFRYAVRRDLDNFQLKSGTSAAFGFVRGLSALSAGPALELDTGSILSHVFDCAVYVSESLLIFFFAAVGLDFCFKLRILSPFPIDKTVPRNNDI